jgi:hypothetical protein
MISQQAKEICKLNTESVYAFIRLCTKVKSTDYKCSEYETPSVALLVDASLEGHIFLSALLHLPSIFAVLFDLDIQFCF